MSKKKPQTRVEDSAWGDCGLGVTDNFVFYHGYFLGVSSAPVGKTTTTHMHCTLNGANYTYGITYDEQYRILEAGENTQYCEVNPSTSHHEEGSSTEHHVEEVPQQHQQEH